MLNYQYLPSSQPLLLDLHTPIQTCKNELEKLILPKPISVQLFKTILEQMFDYWCALAYSDNEYSAFPSEELLDSLCIHDSAPRNHATRAFSNLVSDFNEYLIHRGIYDWFIANGYRRINTKNHNAIFY